MMTVFVTKQFAIFLGVVVILLLNVMEVLIIDGCFNVIVILCLMLYMYM